MIMVKIIKILILAKKILLKNLNKYFKINKYNKMILIHLLIHFNFSKMVP